MRIALLLTIALMAPVPAIASDRPLSTPLQATAISALPEFSPAGQREGEKRDRLALNADSRLMRELELASPEHQIRETPVAGDEFELRLPEEDLPDSDIPLTLNDKVEYFVRYFQTSGRNAFSRWLSRSERYIPMMKEVLKKEGLPEDLVYLAMIESGFSPHAYSVASAVGPWQFMSATGKRYSLRIDSWIDERRDPLKSTVAAAMYLKELYGLFNRDWYLAAAGYNAGENKIIRAIGMYNSTDFWEIAKGSYLKRETKEYVPRLLAAAIIAKEPARYGFADVAYLPPIEFDSMTIPSRTDLEVAARACGVPAETLRDLNPELRRWATPPDYPDYQLKVPRGRKALCETEYAKVAEGERYTERTVNLRHRAKKGETLALIAKRYGTTTQALAELNSLGTKAKIRGRVIVVPVKASFLDGKEEAKTARASRPAAEAKGFTKYYTVKRGDTVPSVAKRFNVSARLISLWNNLKGKVALKAGKRIIVAKFVEKKGAMVPVEENS